MLDPNVPPPLALLQIMTGGWAMQAVGTFARLRIADALGQGQTTAEAIARAIEADADAVHRLLRACGAAGVVRATGPKTYALTAVGELLRSDVPGSMRATLDSETAPGHWLPWARLDECVRTGKSVIDDVLGSDIWTYYERNPAEGRTFSASMASLSAMAIAGMDAVYTFPDAKHVVDVGGAHGAFLAYALTKLPGAKGTLFDRPDVLAAAPDAERITKVPGDFMRQVPEGGDLYLLKHILHDWDDATCKAILENVRSVMARGARVVVVEMLVPEDGSPSPAALLDLNMLVMLPGRERTEREMRELFTSAGFNLARVVPTPSPIVVLECTAA